MKKQEEDRRKGLQYESRLAGLHAKEANETDEAGKRVNKQVVVACIEKVHSHEH